MKQDKTVFLTGGSGVLGQAILNEQPSFDILCLVNQSPLNHGGFRKIQGNISRQKLGLDQVAFEELTSQIEVIIHSAAITDFNRPESEIFETNVKGTKNIIELAKKANAVLYFVSTAFTYQGSHKNGSFIPNHYERSKIEAEQLVKESGLSYVIIRPSMIAGDSRTGQMARFQGLHYLLALFMKGYLPVMPSEPEFFCDFVPQDWVAQSILALIQNEVSSGEIWLTAGQQAAKMSEMVELGLSEALRLTKRELDNPRFLSLDSFNRLVRPVFLPALPSGIQAVIERALDLARYFNIENPFPSSGAYLSETFQVAPMPQTSQTLIRNLEYWAFLEESGALSSSSEKRKADKATHQ